FFFNALLAERIPRQVDYLVISAVCNFALFASQTLILSFSDPANQPLTTLLGDIASGVEENPNEGKTVKYANGVLVSYGYNTPPFLIYGDVFKLWDNAGGVQSGYGHPIADPQFFNDGTICSIFEGGHIHKPMGGGAAIA